MSRTELEGEGHRIDVDSVPAIRPDVVAADVEDELVLYDPARALTRRLGATATVVWHCIDGTSTIGEIAEDVLAVHGGNRGQVVAELVRQVRSFAGAGLLHDSDQAVAADAAPAGPSGAAAPEPVPADPCAHSNRFGWVGHVSVVAGDHVLGVRCNDVELLALLRLLFAPIAADVPDPEPNFSVRLGQPGRAHRLQGGCRTLVHSASLARVVTALCSALSAYADRRLGDRVLLDAVALVRADEAILVPERLRPRLGGAGQRLADRGLVLSDALPAVSLDGGGVVIGPPAVPVDWAVLEHLDQVAAEPACSGSTPAPGGYQLAGWAWPRPSGGGVPTRAHVAAAASRAVRNRHAVGADRAMATLAAALTATDVVPVPVGSVPTGHVIDAIAGLGSAPPQDQGKHTAARGTADFP